MVKIDSTSFGFITIDGKTYSHDVIVTSEGKVKEGRTEVRHLIGRKEFFDLLFERPEAIVIGSGQGGALEISEEIGRFAKEKGVALTVLPTPEAVKEFNRLCEEGKKVVAYIHVTC
jgi:hypothetical protein